MLILIFGYQIKNIYLNIDVLNSVLAAITNIIMIIVIIKINKNGNERY